MIVLQITVDVKDDRRVYLTLPPEVPTGRTDLLVSVVPQHDQSKSPSTGKLTNAIAIVDHGRGPQLSTSRITVQDVVPYLRENCTNDEIMSVMPVISEAEVEAIRQYVRDNFEVVMEQDRRILERSANREIPAHLEEIRKKGRAKGLALKEQFARDRVRESHGDHSTE
jgi:uncharacterized protein (DUF433 family)